MRILVYGFGPYRQFRDNVTEKILRRLPRRPRVRKIIFPVRFHKGQFLKAIKSARPDMILGLGQCSRGKALRIETRAVNQRRNSRQEKLKPIVPRGVPRLYTDLKLDLGGLARSSNNAGSYVCNYSMYVMLDFIRRKQLAARYGFIHVPRDFSPARARAIVGRALERMAGRK